MSAEGRAPLREIQCGDGLAFLRQTKLSAGDAVVTSLPDISELTSQSVPEYREFLVETSRLCLLAIHPSSVAVFYQTDIKREGIWLDKAYLVQRGAEAAGATCLFHKIVCRVAPGQTTFGRPSYAHLLCFSQERRFPAAESLPDVLPELGQMPWSRAMGTAACELVARFLLRSTSATRVVDPFCGLGTMLAVANAHGMDALGVELSKKRARRARGLRLDSQSG